MTLSCKKPGVAFWASVVVVVTMLVVYPLGFGPACWISSRAQPSGEAVSIAYYPVIRLWRILPEPLKRVVTMYVVLGLPDGTTVTTDHRGIQFF